MNQEPIIEGWAIPIRTKKEYIALYPDQQNIEGPSDPSRYADHTYVVFHNPETRWGCFGRDQGGTKLVSDRGHFKNADQASEPSGQAGIIYGITGVCHQAANRILKGAGSLKLVRDAKGYWASHFMYGAYGIGGGFEMEFENLANMDELKKVQGYDKALLLNKIDVQFAIKNKLNNPLEEAKVLQLAKILTEHKYEIQYHFSVFNIDYNRLINNLMKRFGTVLSDREYEDLFDFPKGQYVIF